MAKAKKPQASSAMASARRRSGRTAGAAVAAPPHMSLAVSVMDDHGLAVAHLDVTGHAPTDYPSVEPTMPIEAQNNADVCQLLFCKLYHLNSYRKELIRRDATGQEVTTSYADATDETDECLAKTQAIVNQQIAVITFPQPPEIQALTTAMAKMETAIANSARLVSLVSFADTVIKT